MNLTLPVSGAWRTTAIDLGQWLPGGSADGRNRRVSPIAVPRGERLLIVRTAGVQPAQREPVFMPQSGLCLVGRTCLDPPPSEKNRAQV